MSSQEVIVSQSTSSVVLNGGVPVRDFDPFTASIMYNDFMADLSPFQASTGTAANPDSALVDFGNTASSSIFGKADILIQAEQGARGGIFASRGTNTDVQRSTVLGECAYDFKARVLVSETAVQTQRTIVGVGLSHGPVDATAEQKQMLQHGVAFLAYGGTANWIATLANNNTLSEVDTGFSCAEWRSLRITINADASVIRFYVDDALVRETNSSFIDLAQTLAWGVEGRDKKSGGSTNSFTLSVDFMYLKCEIDR
jgi:hypothetical protein